MKVHVDQGKCQGHARCYMTCPEVFQIDDVTDRSQVMMDVIPAHLADRVRQAEANCPEAAISVEDQGA